MAKNLVVTSVETGSATEPYVISFNVEEDEKDLQFRILQTETLTSLGVAVHEYGCVIIPSSVLDDLNAGDGETQQPLALELELTGSFSGKFSCSIIPDNLLFVGSSTELTAMSN